MNEQNRSDITPHMVLRAYAIGMFPMADAADDPDIFWVDPDWRGIFPLDGMALSHSLAKTLRRDEWRIRVDHDFEAVIAACAQKNPQRSDTWINAGIKALYQHLFHMGFAHSIEVYDGREHLIGGLYGLHIGAAFFGESMFHRTTNASKIALMHLVARLRYAHFRLLDTQFITPHLASLGAIEISRAAYHEQLDHALRETADFFAWPKDRVMSGSEVIALVREGRKN
jgi:leucyl/phenylalanyl-tRNA--protein transferase